MWMVVTMVSGQVFSKLARTSKNGNPIVFLKIKAPVGNSWQFWNVAVFDQALVALLNDVEEGTPISAIGPSAAEIYQAKGSGEARVAFHLTAEKLLTLR
jgi:hypothetical protein